MTGAATPLPAIHANAASATATSAIAATVISRGVASVDRALQAQAAPVSCAHADAS